MDLNTPNRQKFYNALVEGYENLKATQNPEYSFLWRGSDGIDPKTLADRMMAATLKRCVNKEGDGMKYACKVCGIKHTYKAIFEFLEVPAVKA